MKNRTEKKFILTFAGDTSLGDYYLYRRKDQTHLDRLHRDPGSFFNAVQPLVQDSDYLILNLETVLADKPSDALPNKKYLNADNPQRTINILKQLGVKAVSLANNHSMDYGTETFQLTINHLKKAGLAVIGAGSNLDEAKKPLIIKLKGENTTKNIYIYASLLASRRYHNYGFFAGDDDSGVNDFELESITAEIKKVRSEDPQAMIIIFPHWQGLDYKTVTPKVEAMSRKLALAGADYIIGHGTHNAGHIEKLKSGTIFYSIGNFVFNSPGRYRKMKALPYSLIVRLELEEQPQLWAVKEKYYPLFSDNKKSNFKPRPLKTSEAEELLAELEQKNQDQTAPPLALETDQKGCYLIPLDINNKNNNHILKTTKSLMEPTFQQFLESIYPDQQINYYEEERFSTRALLAKEFLKHGFTSSEIDKYLVVLLGQEQVVFFETESSLTSLLGWRMLKNKKIARIFFKEAGLAVARGAYFSKKEKLKAKNFAESLPGCVLKPSDGRKGKGITVGIYNAGDFEIAWKSALKQSKRGILIEEQFFNGTDARYLVVDGNCVAVYRRILPIVCGNGVDTVKSLIEKKNQEKAQNIHLKNKPILLNDHRMSIIKNQGFGLNSIPLEREKILIDWKASISTGADSYDYTDEVHPGFKMIAEKAAKAIPGLDIVGVDILAHDHTKKPAPDNYIIVEANTRPGIGGHHYPAYGKPRNVAGAIVKYVIKNKTQSNC